MARDDAISPSHDSNPLLHLYTPPHDPPTYAPHMYSNKWSSICRYVAYIVLCSWNWLHVFVIESFCPWIVVIFSHSADFVNQANFWFHSFSKALSPLAARSS
mmetsp:Transcript_17102/g.25120  ORF Transcript_17102/g.25120 Transcript_17102/m.25120 type:complete len:102 (+) Transcript_17102:203-508(+)